MGLLLPSSAYLTAPIHGGAGEEYDVKTYLGVLLLGRLRITMRDYVLCQEFLIRSHFGGNGEIYIQLSLQGIFHLEWNGMAEFRYHHQEYFWYFLLELENSG